MRIPSTQAMRALESFARLGSVWQAAEEINLTRSAISHQLRQLERDLGFTLFNRIGTRVELTPQGLAYAVRNSPRPLGHLRRRRAQLRARRQRHAYRQLHPRFCLILAVPKGRALPRGLPRCRICASSPRAGLKMYPPPKLIFSSAFPAGNHPGMQVELLQEVEFTPLCSPALMNRLSLSKPADALRAGLMHLSDHDDWLAWFRLAGLDESRARTGLVFSDMNLVYSACLASQGIAMGDEFICYEAMSIGTAGAALRCCDPLTTILFSGRSRGEPCTQAGGRGLSRLADRRSFPDICGKVSVSTN
ncbi:MAG: LysR family transcriptional regulator [Cypionkella sp.]